MRGATKSGRFPGLSTWYAIARAGVFRTPARELDFRLGKNARKTHPFAAARLVFRPCAERHTRSTIHGVARTASFPNINAGPASRRDRRRGAIASFVLAGLLCLAPSALGADAQLVDATTDLTAPSGVMRDAHGDLWVSDSHGGICRVIDPPHPAGSVAVSDYCNLDPAAVRVGPVAPGQLAFDPLTDTMFVGDGASGSGGVWRLHLDQSSNPSVIDSAELILDLSNPLVADRVFAMAYHGPSSALDFTTKNSPTIQRIVDPATCAPCIPQNIGSAEDKAVGSITHDASGRLYIADLSGVTSFMPGSLDFQARPVPGMAGSYSAVAFDPVQEGGLIYAGTTNPEGTDQIDRVRLSTGETSTYAVGSLEAVTAIGIDGNGGLDVLDDPGIKQFSENAGGTARRFTVGFEAFAPRPEIIDGPPSTGSQTTVSFLFTYPSSTAFYCQLDGGPALPCGTGAQGAKAYAGLAHGSHTFKLYADNPVTGQRVTRKFVIDTQAPVVSIDSVSVSGSTASVGFSANDLNVDFTCSLDGAAFTPCDSPTLFGGLVDGNHTVGVRATDYIGNQGAVTATTFRVGAPPALPWKPGKVTATLKGRTLRVVFNAPPSAKFARFLLTKPPTYPVRTKTVRVKAGARNVITINLTRAEAKRLQGKKFLVRVQAGATQRQLTTAAGKTTLKILTALRPG